MSCVQHSFCSHPLLSLSRHPCFRLVEAGLASLRLYFFRCNAVRSSSHHSLSGTPSDSQQSNCSVFLQHRGLLRIKPFVLMGLAESKQPLLLTPITVTAQNQLSLPWLAIWHWQLTANVTNKCTLNTLRRRELGSSGVPPPPSAPIIQQQQVVNM